MPNVKRYLKYGSKTANVLKIVQNVKRKLAKHLKKQPNDLKAKLYLESL